MKYSEKLVSVIVPAYNVVQYVEKCVLSILAQSHKNIELVVVNDGSTDGTLEVLKKIASTDERLHVVDKQNEGVSAARNSGLEVATGDFIVFVDGDDWIASDYIEYMLYLIEKTGCDFCLSRKYFVSKDDKREESDNIRIFNTEQITSYFLSPDTIVYSPNCIIKKALLEKNNLRFSSKLYYGEGLTFTTTLAQLCERVGVGERKVYYYRRNNDTSATTKFNINKYVNGEIALNNIGKSLKVRTNLTMTMLNLHKCIFYVGAILQMKSGNVINDYQEEYNKWRKFVGNNIDKLIFSPYVSLYRKAILVFGYFFPSLLCLVNNFRRKRIYRNSVN